MLNKMLIERKNVIQYTGNNSKDIIEFFKSKRTGRRGKIIIPFNKVNDNDWFIFHKKIIFLIREKYFNKNYKIVDIKDVDFKSIKE